MRNSWAVLVGVLTATGCARTAGQSGGTPAGVAEAVEAAELAWARAIVAADTVTLGRILAAEFELAGEGGAPPFPRAAWLTNVGTRRVYSDSIVIDSLHVSGTADSAVATMRYFWRPLVNGQRMPDDQPRLEDRWVMRDGRWQAVQRRRLGPPRPQ